MSENSDMKEMGYERAANVRNVTTGAREWLDENYEWDRHGRGYIQRNTGQLVLFDGVLAAYRRDVLEEAIGKVEAEYATVTQEYAPNFNSGIRKCLSVLREMSVEARND